MNDIQWSYEGATGPEHWGALSPDFAIARDGCCQSPVDVDTRAVREADLPRAEVRYAPSTLERWEVPHNVEFLCPGGGTLTVGERTFELVRFHFHAPGEHLIDGTPAAMEVHFVHEGAAGALAVLGVRLVEGDAHPAIERLWRHLPGGPGLSDAFRPEDLLPESRGYYTYPGSLTTPPCAEGVTWLLLKDPISISPEQVAAYRALYPKNARPVQPLHERVVEATRD